MAVWEMTSLLIAPKKVFKSIYYHVSGIGPSDLQPMLTVEPRNVSDMAQSPRRHCGKKGRQDLQPAKGERGTPRDQY